MDLIFDESGYASLLNVTSFPGQVQWQRELNVRFAKINMAEIIATGMCSSLSII